MHEVEAVVFNIKVVEKSGFGVKEAAGGAAGCEAGGFEEFNVDKLGGISETAHASRLGHNLQHYR